jgi:carboxylesterase type B
MPIVVFLHGGAYVRGSTQQMAREVEHWRDRAARAEQWLRTIQQEIEEKLLTRRSSSGAEGVAVR